MAKVIDAGDSGVNGKLTLYTNENNSSTLKVLIAANFGGKPVELKLASLSDCIVPGPRQLPLLVVSGELSFFSSNAAAAYLFPVIDVSQNGLCQQWQEWEATRLLPAVQRSAKERANVELQSSLAALLQHLEDSLTDGYLIGSKISAADVSIWSTLYHVRINEKLNTTYLVNRKNIQLWFDRIKAESAVQEAIKQWNGDGSALAETSILGTACAPAIASPTVDEKSSAVTSEELSAAEDGWLNCKLQAPFEPSKVVLPVKDRRNILITSALPYVNNVPHLGNIIGCVLSADIFARYCRCMGYNTLFVCGTDEYGTATETKALEENLTPRQICDKYFEIHNDIYRWFNIGFDYFGRTSTPEQTEITQRLFLKLKDHGFISSQSVDQLLCKRCNRFLADRFVEGTCPHPGCGYEGARGDQCDKCGKLVNATELIEARCKVCGESPAVTKSSQFFLELPQLEPSLRSWFSKQEAGWSGSARAVARSWFRDGLRSRCITRDLKWGVPVPVDGFRDKVFYVWFDACIGYISITKRYTGEYEKWWRPEPGTDVKLYQFMAKDNVPFHSIIFPATLMGVNEGHTLVSHIFATEYLNYEEGKFSKSRGVGVFGTDAQETGITADVWRFYLASVRPEGQDSSFSWAELGTRNNSELLNNLGNFCHRSLSFCAGSLKGVVPAVRPRGVQLELIALVNREIAAYVQNMERGKIRDALRHVLSVSRLGNQHMQSEQPWVLLKGSPEDRERGETAIALCCNLVALVGSMLAPYMPETCARLAGQLNVERNELRLNFEKPCLHQYLPEGHRIGKPEPLFSKLEPAMLDELKIKYAGTQTERAERDTAGKSESGSGLSISQLESEIAKQGEKVRQLKSQTKDKASWTPEVNRLLELKKQLAAAQETSKSQGSNTAKNVSELENAVAEQGEKVRQLKCQTKDKTLWMPEVNRLLELKKQLAAAQGASSNQVQSSAVSKTQKSSAAESTAKGSVQVLTPVRSDLTIEPLQRDISEQGEKVRKLKAQTKDKSVWMPEVNRLLELKKKLSEAQQALNKPIETAVESQITSPEIERLLVTLDEQAQRVRSVKARTKDKTLWAPEVNRLLELKKQIAELRISASKE